MRFVKVRKDNNTHDRGFIAVDAICSVFENAESHNVSIMTMDGFWYDCDDDVDELYAVLTEDESKGKRPWNNPKKEYYRKKKLMTPRTETERAPQNHEKVMKDGNRNNADVAEDVFRDSMPTSEQSFPTGVGEGQNRHKAKAVNPARAEWK